MDGAGASQIGFGGTADDVAQRIAYINDLYRTAMRLRPRGGPFQRQLDGRPRTGRRSSSRFAGVLANVAVNNGLDSDGEVSRSRPRRWSAFARPIWQPAPAFTAALKDNGFRYDTVGRELCGKLAEQDRRSLAF